MSNLKSNFMRKLIGLAVFLFIVGIHLSMAQEKTVTGKVTDASDGSPLPGVTIMIKGGHTGTSTDVEGKYSLKVPENAVLVFSFVGMKTQEVSVAGKAAVDIRMESESKRMEEVVVTAIGIRKSEKTLGYAASTVKSDELVAGRSADVMSGMIGKVAGVNISNSGQTGASQKVVVRGYSSFSSNQPLYVVDGVPVQNTFSGVGDFSSAVDFGNQAGDINPDDVESVTVLKGASATALYGSRAANGVIMITTKQASQNQRISVVYSGSFMGSDVLRVPQTQDMFGQGWPYWDRAENGSWGPKLDGRMHDWGAPVDGVYRQKPFSYVKDNLRNFYETGFEMTNSVSISGGNSHTGFMLSYSNTNSDGVIPSSADSYDRNTFSFRGNTKYKRFEASYNVNYVRKDVHAVSTGQGDDGATIFPELLQHAVDVNFQDVKDWTNPYNNTDNYYTWYAENPYWVVANNGNKYQDDRVYGKVELAYEILPGLKAIGRLGGDFTNSRQKRWNAIARRTPGSYCYGSKNDEVGYYYERRDNWNQLDVTAMLSGSFKLSEDFSLDGVVGYNYNQRSTSYHESGLSGLNVEGWYSFANGNVLPNTTSIETRRRLIGLLGQFNLSFRNYWFVTASLRNDWSSTLPIGKNSFFYWGVNTSLVLSDMFPGLQDSKVDFLKIRAAYGQTGNDAPVYRTKPVFVPTQIGLGFGNVYLPFDGQAGLTVSNRIANMDLKPEITTELEFGIDGRFFDNRLTFDLAYYKKLTKDQIISATIAPETGYTSRTQNIGKIQNQGIELAVNVVPVKYRDFQWDLGITFSKNYSKVKKLWEGSGGVYRIGGGYSVDYMAIEGEELGIFMAPTEARVKEGPYQGAIIVNSAGRPQVSTDGKEEVGSSNPNFVMGFNTHFTWKGITLGAVVDWRNGGHMWSYTAHIMHFNGNATPTVFNERQPFVIPNSVKVVNGEYVENDIPITWSSAYSYYNNSTNTPIQKNFVIPKDFVKLRELTLSYTLPKKWFDDLFISKVEVGFVGRNLFLWTPKKNNYVDPEATNYGNDLYSEIGEFAAAPTTRTFGGTIKITF